MDLNRDNPIIRFTTFWWGIATFLIFAALLAVIWLFVRSKPTTLEDAAAKPRYVTKAKIDAAQAANISAEAVEVAISTKSRMLAMSKPVAVELPAQVVPGSETSKKLAAAPAVDTKAIDSAGVVDGPLDAAAMAVGQTAFVLCAACHGQNGEGGAIAPPLAGSEWVKGSVSNLIRIQLRGMQGPITVAGKEYNMVGGMAPLNHQTDDQIAGVLTYVRNSFGNKASGVKPEQVAALRSEVGKPQCTVAELTKP
jgi:mono/diheme cytochrome c family protein